VVQIENAGLGEHNEMVPRRHASILVCPALAYCQASDATSSAGASPNVEHEVKEAIRQRLDALRRGDAKIYVSYFGDDCIITSDNGALVKPEDIAKEWADDLHADITFKGGEPLDV
jgi:hypothetical protein